MNSDNIVGDWRTASQHPSVEIGLDRNLADEHLRFLVTLLGSGVRPEDKINFITNQLQISLDDGSYYDLELKLLEAIKSLNIVD